MNRATAVAELRLAGRWEAAAALAAFDLADPDVAVAAAEVEVDRHFFAGANGADEALGHARRVLAAAPGSHPASERLDLIALFHDYVTALFAGTERDPGAARDLGERAAQLAGTVRDPLNQGWAVFYRGIIADNLARDHDAGSESFRTALELADECGDGLLASYACRHIAGSSERAGDLATATELAERALTLRQRIGFIPGALTQLLQLAGLAEKAGDPERAATMRSEALRWLDALGCTRLTGGVATG